MTKVVLADVQDGVTKGEALFSALDDVARQKALRYLRKEDQVRSALASLLIRKEVGDGLIRNGPFGKPFIEGKASFNVSHSQNWVGICVDNEEIGFDLEWIPRCDLSIARVAFTEEERTLIVDRGSFAYAWTRKEAVAKCLGRGIESPSSVGVSSLNENDCSYKGERYFLAQWEQGEYVFCVAKKTPVTLEPISVVDVASLIG
ncbi:MAG: 4'-phosphopantetheinyl transferase superfamily protein [Bacilli bacterium]|nr:4'-phosphopantetheinyl transferase superfamily protein [Bacilli bacterium]